MNAHLENIIKILTSSDSISDELKLLLTASTKSASKELDIALFKLDRTEKVKRTTAILLEETIEELEQKRRTVEESHVVLQQTLADLKATQAQLIQSEKMASLGELTAGIAHEIQNPLNFVNNFSEVSFELLEEMQAEIEKGDLDEARLLIQEIKQNLEKITHHGKRADAIVKGMLQHSKTGSGKKENTDINALCEEYLRLSFHGVRSKDKNFNSQLKTEFDESIEKINVIPQDIGRVIMNLLTNAFYAVNEKSKLQEENYKASVTVSTKKRNEWIEISVADNGNGISEEIVEKIFQPFFTTKPTGQGTGLGLSLSYDIIKVHGGRINVQSQSGEGSIFTISLPVS